MRKVALVFFTRSHQGVFQPVYNHLRAQGWSAVALPGYDREAVELGEPIWMPDGAVLLNAASPAKIFRSAPSPAGGESGSWSQSWLQLARLRWSEQGLIERSIALREELKQWLLDYRPDLVIVPEESDYLRGRLACALTRELGIPTLAVYPPYYHLHRDYPMLGAALADGYVVFTDELASRLQSRGIPSESILRVSRILPPLQRRKGVNSLLFVSQGFSQEALIVEDLKRAGERVGLEVRVRPHPRRDGRAESGASLERELAQVVAIATQSSAVLFRAIWSGLPTLIAHYGAGPYAVGLKPNGERIQVFSNAVQAERALANLVGLGSPPVRFAPRSRLDTSVDAGREFGANTESTPPGG